MLVMRLFDGVEKIKTIGSTYMAATGLNVQPSTQNVRVTGNPGNRYMYIFTVYRKSNNPTAVIKTWLATNDKAFVQYKLALNSKNKMLNYYSCLLLLVLL